MAPILLFLLTALLIVLKGRSIKAFETTTVSTSSQSRPSKHYLSRLSKTDCTIFSACSSTHLFASCVVAEPSIISFSDDQRADLVRSVAKQEKDNYDSLIRKAFQSICRFFFGLHNDDVISAGLAKPAHGVTYEQTRESMVSKSVFSKRIIGRTTTTWSQDLETEVAALGELVQTTEAEILEMAKAARETLSPRNRYGKWNHQASRKRNVLMVNGIPYFARLVDSVLAKAVPYFARRRLLVTSA
jgi:hypothetical protein